MDRSTAYGDENIDQTHLGNLSFTYAETQNINPVALTEFYDIFSARYGIVPTREAIRGYELLLDLSLRTAIRKNLIDGFALGETMYYQNKFMFSEQSSGGFQNTGIFLLQHKGYETVEITEN